MKLDKCTFGKSPAAMYLVQLLNERGSPKEARKCSRILEETRELVNDLVACHLHSDDLKTRSFGKLINLVRFNLDLWEAETTVDAHLAALCVNILKGELKLHLNRLAKAGQVRQHVARATPEGTSVPDVKAVPIIGEPSYDERIERLRAKSSAYLKRKGKINTLYGEQ
jgi:hypothetical protein